ncbi:uncharacterized protein LOC116002236 [Ipomoea triloba]|uniref:uncharacterized protein LOC116002236 n=1 Tax=Ipomoea triloba TaxID=35885 RepID=UPI00125DA864|nr:uncharacterized protein LOC116002236 [Ipomoea triloba]
MACLNMLSNEQQVAAARISFSNDFADSSQHPITLRQDFSYKEAPVSSDNFEFSVSGYTMISADQVFCKGKLLPLKDSKTTTTLRDELLQGNDDDNDYGDLFPRIMQPNKGWRERLGLKRSHIIFPRKPAHNKNNNLERIDETKVPDLFNATQHKSK